MLRSVLNVKIHSNQEMRNHAEQDMMVIKNQYQNLKNSELQPKINYILEKKSSGWFEQINDLLNKEENRMIKELSDELRVLSGLCEIYKNEYCSIKQTSLEKFSSLEMMKQIYQEAIFYLRRMEFDMEDEVCKEFLVLMNQWEFSIDYIRIVLKNGAIHNKKHTTERLVQLLRENGYMEYSELLLKDLEERSDIP